MSTIVFDSDLAVKYGVNEAIFIQHLQYMINHHKAHNHNFHEGRYWNYNSVRYFTDHMYKFWSTKQLRNIIKSLIDQNVIISGNYNKNKYDRTTWYAFVDEESFIDYQTIDSTHLPSGENPFAQNECFSSLEEESENPLDSRVSEFGFPESNTSKHLSKRANGCVQKGQPIPILNNHYNNPLDIERGLRGDNLPPTPPEGGRVSPFGSAPLNTGAALALQSQVEPVIPISDDFQEVQASRRRVLEGSSALEPKAESKSRSKKGSRLPEDWVLPLEWRSWSMANGMGASSVDLEEIKFRNHWLSTTKNPIKMDWYRTWQNWCINCLGKFAPQGVPVIKSTSQAPEPVKPIVPIEVKPSSNPKIQRWHELQSALRERVGTAEYTSWLADLELVSFDKKAIFKAPNAFKADQIYNRFIDDIAAILAKIDPNLGIEIYIRSVV